MITTSPTGGVESTLKSRGSARAFPLTRAVRVAQSFTYQNRSKENRIMAKVTVVLSGAEATALAKALSTVKETKTTMKITDKVQAAIAAVVA